ncbi:MAG: U32 family peptidase [Thermodesulfovibrionales bacterium]
MKRPEVLAPAGDFEKLRTAIHYGADAVFLGDSRFSLRGKAGNFHGGELKAALHYAHERGVRVYVTMNIFPHNRDLPAIRDHIQLLREAGPDAVILSDPGLFMMFRREAPGIDLHISTQANVTNVESARFWEELGAQRLVLARELSLAEIREICRNTSIELEAFVHGSLCVSYSGRCYLSSFLASRGANRGECTNSCRWNYTLMEEKRPGEYLPVFEDDRGTYIMSSRDLCMVEHLPLLAEAGVSSFKIEGRMKGINYVAGVVKTYREAVDALSSGEPYTVPRRWLRELSLFSNRGYTTGMYFGKQPDSAYTFDGESYVMSRELVGVVKEIDGGMARIALRNRIDEGDEIEYLSPGIEEERFRVEFMRDGEGSSLSTARNGDVILMPVPEGVRSNDLIRREKASGEAEQREAPAGLLRKVC